EFVYWNKVDKTWWWLNPHAFEQGPASSELEAYSIVGKFETAYSDAHYQGPTCAYCGDFYNEFSRSTPALAHSMEIMGAYMFFFTGPTGEMGSLTSLGLEGVEQVAQKGSTALVTMSEASYATGSVKNIAGYEVAGNAGLVGKTYNVNVWG